MDGATTVTSTANDACRVWDWLLHTIQRHLIRTITFMHSFAHTCTHTHTAPMDFQNIREVILQFDSVNTFFTMNIPILDDDILEYDEIFFANLTKSDNAVILQPDTAEITIKEDDGT